MKSQILHTVWCNISGEAEGEIRNWSLLGVKGLKEQTDFPNEYAHASRQNAHKYLKTSNVFPSISEDFNFGFPREACAQYPLAYRRSRVVLQSPTTPLPHHPPPNLIMLTAVCSVASRGFPRLTGRVRDSWNAACWAVASSLQEMGAKWKQRGELYCCAASKAT